MATTQTKKGNLRRVSPEDRDRRREQVMQLLVMGYSSFGISKSLGVPRTTVQGDVTWIQTQLLKDALPTLQLRIAQSVAVYKETQISAWQLYHKADDKSLNKTGALNSIQAAQAKIDELQGTTAPEKMHAAALAEAYELAMRVLGKVGGSALQIEFLKTMHEETRDGMNQVLLSGHTAAQQRAIVDASPAEPLDNDEDEE